MALVSAWQNPSYPRTGPSCPEGGESFCPFESQERELAQVRTPAWWIPHKKSEPCLSYQGHWATWICQHSKECLADLGYLGAQFLKPSPSLIRCATMPDSMAIPSHLAVICWQHPSMPSLHTSHWQTAWLLHTPMHTQTETLSH